MMWEDYVVIFRNTRKFVGRMNRRQYARYFKQFERFYGDLIEGMVEYVEKADNKKVASREIGEAVTTAAKKVYGKRSNGELRGNVQKHLDTFMVMYVFPGILRTENESAEITAKGLLEIWNRKKSMGSNISYVDYDKIYNGFKR